MKTRHILILFMIGLFMASCEQSTKQSSTSLQDSGSSPDIISDTIQTPSVDRSKIWKEITNKLEPIKIPGKIECKNMDDSLQFELTKEQLELLIPKEVIQQKDPVVSALYTLKVDTLIIGTFYYIQYPVVYDKLYDTTCEIVLILYNKEGIYTDFKTLAIDEYGSGYSKIKSLNEILYLYSSEMETIETDIKTYSIVNNVTIEEVNKVHFSSRGSQQEYDRNNERIEKYMN
jgi:hypothetical protein